MKNKKKHQIKYIQIFYSTAQTAPHSVTLTYFKRLQKTFFPFDLLPSFRLGLWSALDLDVMSCIVSRRDHEINAGDTRQWIGSKSR